MTTTVDRDTIFLLHALVEARRGLHALNQVKHLAQRVELRPATTGVRENESVFMALRLGLQCAANVSRVFWSPRKPERSARLRQLAHLSDNHPMSNRTLRNHVEHIDERLDDWTEQSPRPFLAIEQVIYADMQPSPYLDEAVASTAVTYDQATNVVTMLDEPFNLDALAAALEDVRQLASAALQRLQTKST